jgi:gluconate 2-dehydrogenase gamma chain
MSDDQPPITRRTVLRGAALVGATVVAAPACFVSPFGLANAAEAAPAGFTHLTASEGDLLQIIVDRLIPSDASGPGAKEARVAFYIDGALGDALAASRPAYAMGLAALDRYAQSSRGKPFSQLSPTDQDSVLIDCETGGATGFTGSSAQFFAMLLNHTRQGMFGDPHYGGNANFVGWDLIGYPGARTAVTAADQKALEANQMKAVRRSAYDYNGFTKEHHGD